MVRNGRGKEPFRVQAQNRLARIRPVVVNAW
jgi:hypothetical protein